MYVPFEIPYKTLETYIAHLQTNKIFPHLLTWVL